MTVIHFKSFIKNFCDHTMLYVLYSLLSHRKVRENDRSRDSEADIETETYHRAIFR